MRGKLFIKIFLGFWLVTIAILGSWMLTNEYFDSQPEDADDWHQQHRVAGPPHRFMLRIIYDLQNLDTQALSAVLEDIRHKHKADIYLIDQQGSDILGRGIPEEARRAADKLNQGRRRAALNTEENRLVAHAIYRPEHGPLRAVLVFPNRPPGLLRALGRSPGLRILLAIAVSGLICYVLSRLVTNRLKRVQQASRRLANGDLDTRLVVRDQGGDETDELARDFNSMAAQLQDRIQAQKRLLGDVSHELRSPLARLRVALALAQDNEAGRDEYMLRIEQEAERLETLIGQLLSSQAQTLALDVHIDLVALLQQLCADANFEGQVEGKEFVFTSALEQAVIASAEDLLHKCFENILRNALVHTAENSRVEVTLTLENERFLIGIEDRGPGVPEQELDKLFGEFYRVDTARARESGGYGLGLAIAQRAIVQHGGEISASNTGTGLLIEVSLPLSAQGELPVAP